MRDFYSRFKNYNKVFKSVLAGVAMITSPLAYGQLYQVSGTCTMLNSSSYGPMYSTTNANATSRVAVIYPASQLTGISGKSLSAIYYKKGTSTDMTGSPSFKIYLKETSDTNLGATAPDWNTVTIGATLVYDSNPNTTTAGAAGWKPFNFSTNFNYSGTNNLMVITEYISNGNTVSNTWSYEYNSPCVNTSDNKTTRYTNNTTGNPGTSLSSNDYRRPQIAFDYLVSCMWPSNLAVTSTTSNSASLIWTAPTSTSPTGYDIYYSTINTPPTSTSVPQHTNIAGTSYTVPNLQPGTPYYFWVRSYCSSTESSDWLQAHALGITSCDIPTLTSVTGETICANTSATLTASGSSGAIINWYDTPIGGNLVHSGNSFTTPPLSATTDYWAAAGTLTGNYYVGPTTPGSLGSTSNTNTLWNLMITATQSVVLNSVDVFSNTAGQSGTIEILDSNNNIVSSTPFVTSGAGANTPQTVQVNTNLSPGDYQIKRNGAANLHRTSAGATFPYIGNGLNITGTTFTNYPNYYFYFFNLNYTSWCESPRQQVTATVDANACLSTSESKGKENIKVYPNPFSDFISINKIESVKTVNILDVAGKLIRTIPTPSSKIQLDYLPSGLYLINIEMKDGSTQSTKIIKK